MGLHYKSWKASRRISDLGSTQSCKEKERDLSLRDELGQLNLFSISGKICVFSAVRLTTTTQAQKMTY